MRKIIFQLILSIFMVNTSWAIDPGRSSGRIENGDQKIELKHAVAHECIKNRRDFEIRILLTEKELPDEILTGCNKEFGFGDLARQEKLRGVYMVMCEKNGKRGLTLTAVTGDLSANDHPVTFTITDKKQLEKIVTGYNRVGGKLNIENAKFHLETSFSAPIFHDVKAKAGR